MSWRGASTGGGEPSVDAQLEELFTKLSECAEQGSHKRVLKCADDVLKISPGDADAVRCRVTALIELQRFADCAETIEKDVVDAELRKELAFERAYALYKCGKTDDALRVLQTETSEDERESTRAVQLEAQLMYRAGRHEEAATMYETLFRDHADEVGESPNTAVNLAAAMVAAGRGADLPAALKRLKISPKDSFELAFNFACALVECGNLTDAADYLTLAKNQGAETLMDEDLDEDAVADELMAVDAQRAFVAEMLGRKDEAAEGYRAALAIESTDAATRAIVANNLAALVGSRGEGGADAMRRTQRNCDKDGKLNDVLVGKLSERQRRTLVVNRAKALLHSNHLDRCRDALGTLRKLDGDAGAKEAVMLEAALFMRERKPEKAVKLLGDVVAKGGDVGTVRDARLALAQIHASAGDYANAIDALRGVSELEGTAAGAATLVALHELAGDASGADAVLDASSGGASAGGAPPEVALRAAERKLTRGAAGEAMAMFESVAADPAADEDDKLAACAGIAFAKAQVGDVDGAEADASGVVRARGVRGGRGDRRGFARGYAPGVCARPSRRDGEAHARQARCQVPRRRRRVH
jgi:signal recognition particle subunit SRP72